LKNIHTFDHLSSRECIICTFLVAGRIVEEEQPLHIPMCETLKDIDSVVYLGEQVVGRKPAVPVLPRLEENLGFTVQT
jgi:hypothetical protein